MEPEQLQAKAVDVPRSVAREQKVAEPPLLQAAGNRAVARLLAGAPAPLQRAALRSQGAGPLDGDIAAAIDAQRGGGSPLPKEVQGDMEHHLGADLSSVRVHTGGASDSLNRAVQADAFTTGTDVFVSSDRYSPSSNDGRRLLAHELTHVVQQANGTGSPEGEVSHPGHPSEVEAAQVADKVSAAPRVSEAAPSVARSELEGLDGDDAVARMALARQDDDEGLEEEMA